MRLCPGVVQPLSFTVPRVRMELFQDDIFPPATPTWTPATSVDAFWRGDAFVPLDKVRYSQKEDADIKYSSRYILRLLFSSLFFFKRLFYKG